MLLLLQPIPLGVSFSKAQNSKLERLFCHVSMKRDVRALNFDLWNSIRKCHPKWDWLYLATNCLAALLEALFARIIPFRFVNIGFSWRFFCFGVCARSLTKPFFCPPQPGSCAWLSPFVLCADCTCVLVCVCLCMWMWKCVGKVINI